ncbi:MAG: hypothetical protein ABI378_12455 [Chitinophagaceae bacterium]
MDSEKKFTLLEVEKLVKNAFEVGFCDGIDSIELEKTDFINADDFWNQNIENWISKEISYVV